MMPSRETTEATGAKEDFTGYEKDEETQLLYAGARYYMPALGRFGVTDRFADKEPGLTPYQYAANNPIRNIDVNGDSVIVGFKDIFPPTGATKHSVLVHVNEETGNRRVIAEAQSEANAPIDGGDVAGWGRVINVTDTDFAEKRLDQFTAENSETVPIPEGMTETDFVAGVDAAVAGYRQGSKEYSPLPHLEPNTLIGGDRFGNSNAFVGTMLRRAGSNFEPGATTTNGSLPLFVGPVNVTQIVEQTSPFLNVKAPGWNVNVLR